MKALTLWLQNNPMAILIMFIVAILSGIMTIILGWRAFYADYLSKAVTVPVWLLILVLIIGCLFAVQFVGRQSGDTVVKELEAIEGKRFGVQQIVVDGKKFERCKFDGSEIIFNGKAGFSLIGCQFKSPRITFASYASNTVNALTLMYKDPSFKPIVEQTIENIRAGKHSQSTPITTLNRVRDGN
jgi:hypothetical protein